MILGWSTTLSIALLWILFERIAYKTLFIPLFGVSVLIVGLTGHYGGQITHGEEYLSIPVAEEKEASINLDSIQLYSQAVAKIFDKKCVSCHNFSKRKGELALHQPQAILEGGERGMPYLVGNSMESRIIEYAALPLEDDLHMPPKGRPQLTSTELKILAYWIDQGGHFEGTASFESLPQQVQTSFAQFLPKELPDVSPLKASVLLDLQQAGFRITSYTADTPFIQAKFKGETLDRSAIKVLLKAAEQLVELELSNFELPDRFWEEVESFQNLLKLKLNETNTEDHHVEKLINLPLR